MKKIYIILAFILIFNKLSLINAVEIDRGEIDINIRFYERRIYYINTNPILVQVTITNNSPEPFRFKFAEDRVFSVDFDIRTMTNKQVQPANSFLQRRHQVQTMFFREITLENGESFSFIEDLRDYAIFSQPGSYRVRVKMYPELIKTDKSVNIESNYLSLSIRPELIKGADGIAIEMDMDTGAVLARQQLYPDEVITYTLEARQKSQWERYFLYFDLEAMYTRDSNRKRRYLAENEDGRRVLLNTYRENLKDAVIDSDVSIIPNAFTILETTYTGTEGKVTALLEFWYPTYKKISRYTYFLEKKGDYWVIVNYMVSDTRTDN